MYWGLAYVREGISALRMYVVVASPYPRDWGVTLRSKDFDNWVKNKDTAIAGGKLNNRWEEEEEGEKMKEEEEGEQRVRKNVIS